MATRFYISNQAGDISPAFDSSWEDTTLSTGTNIRREMRTGSQSPTTINDNVSNSTDGTTNQQEVLLGQYISVPINAQTISSGGTGTLSCSLSMLESDKKGDLYLYIHARVVTSAGATRGTLLSQTVDNTELDNPAESSIYFSGTLSQVTAVSGDYIVIEVGAGGVPQKAETFIAYLSRRSNQGTDLPASDGDTNAYNGWFELSDDISFQGTTYSRTAAITGSGSAAVDNTVIRPVTLTSSGTVTVSETIIRNRSVTITADGSATSYVTVYRSVSVIASGNVSADHSHLLTAHISADGTVSTNYTQYYTRWRTATVTSTATVVATRTHVTTYFRTAAITASGTVDATRTFLGLYVRTASVTSTATVAVTPKFYRQGSYVTSGTVDVSYTVLRASNSQITGTATVDIARSVYRPASATITSDGDVVATRTFVGTYIRTASITGTASVFTTHTVHILHAHVYAYGNVAAIGTKVGTGILPRQAAITATGTVSAARQPYTNNQTATITAVGSVVVPKTASATISATGRVVSGWVHFYEQVTYSASANLTAIGRKIHHGSYAFSGTATLDLGTSTGRIVNHSVAFGPGGISYYPEDFFDIDWYDDRYMKDYEGGMVGGFNAVGRLISASNVAVFDGRGTFRAYGTFIPSWVTYPGTAAFDNAGTFIASGSLYKGGQAFFSGEASFAIEVSPGRATFFCEGQMVANGALVNRNVTSAFFGEGTLIANGDRVRNATVSFDNVGTLALDGELRKSPIYIARVFEYYKRRRVT